ncbi:MAG: NAD(P)H-hydrate dehydratase [Pyrinomonadaceae bacterium]|nr:NAD(P)H-hydrate dehydratase [Pyrinomonadaceae bacterium]MCX7639750.1 NAD(P)H-hydrate dehydratase [Pyrinomonadaceae bacterium]MDW8304333.1 NAD(P)H-hydrate dehydratase [Acidobacteriota bacterium]
MQRVLTAEQMRFVDEQTEQIYKLPSILLMENAAQNVVRAIEQKVGLRNKKFLVVCGRGNNGGDGAAIARLLWMKGASVIAVLIGKVEQTKADARVNFEVLRSINGLRSSVKSTAFEFFELSERDSIEPFLSESDVVIDAIFGTGLSRPVEGRFAEIIAMILSWKERRRGFLIAVDLPSGVNSDDYKIIGDCLRADLTVTFTAPKIANVLPPAANYCGEVVVANIGSPKELIDSVGSKIFFAEREDAFVWLEKTQVSSSSYKKERGRVLIVAGSDDYIGAAALAANGCFSAGAGMVTLAVPRKIKFAVASKTINEIIVRAIEDETFFFEDYECVAVGCGLESSEETKQLVRRLVEGRTSAMILDAEALNSLSPFDLKSESNLPLILTPHIGEFERLLGRKVSDRVKDAAEFAVRHGVILLLKGERNLIIKPDGTVVVIPTGDSGVSRAGAGDTLTGILSAFVAQTVARCGLKAEEIFESVVAGTYIAGLAAEIASKKFSRRFMTPTSVLDCLKQAIIEVTGEDGESISL